jgi:hypothetical protein
VNFLFADCSDALTRIQSVSVLSFPPRLVRSRGRCVQAFRTADLDLPKDKAQGGHAINLGGAATSGGGIFAGADLADLDGWDDNRVRGEFEDTEDLAQGGQFLIADASQDMLVDADGRVLGGFGDGQGFDDHCECLWA